MWSVEIVSVHNDLGEGVVRSLLQHLDVFNAPRTLRESVF